MILTNECIVDIAFGWMDGRKERKDVQMDGWKERMEIKDVQMDGWVGRLADGWNGWKE